MNYETNIFYKGQSYCDWKKTLTELYILSQREDRPYDFKIEIQFSL